MNKMQLSTLLYNEDGTERNCSMAKKEGSWMVRPGNP